MVARAHAPSAPDKPIADKGMLRMLTRTLYDRQGERIMIGNRLAGHFRAQLGQEPGRPTEDLSLEAQDLIKQLRIEHSRLADALVRADRRRWQKMLDETAGIIHTPEELVLVHDYVTMEEHEARLGRDVAVLVKEFPIWVEFLEGVRGCGPLMSAVLIGELDPHPSPYVSNWWSLCLPEGSLVSTMHGMVPIEELHAGQQVLDATGRVTEIKGTMARQFTGELVTLDVLGALPLTVTDEHPVLVVRKGTEQWLAAREIVPGDKLVLPTLQEETRSELRFEQYTPEALSKSPFLGRPMPVTPDLAYLLGRFVGDGSAATWVEDAVYRRGRVQVAFALEEEAEAEAYRAAAKTAFGAARVFQGTETLQVTFGRATLAEHFQRWFGHLAHNKKIPESIMGLADDETIRSFLRGYVDTDGHMVKEGKSAGTIMVSSASLGLILQVQHLLTKLGVFGSVHRQQRPSVTGMIGGRTFAQRVDRYILSIPKSSVHRIYPDAEARFNRAARKITKDGERWLLTVKRVLHSPVVDRPVYNLHTGSNTYLVQNLAVHNCGLDVAADGAGRSRRAEHLVDRVYTDKEGKEATRKSITFNPFLKTKLMGVLAPSFLRSASPYRAEYDQYKHRMESHAKYGLAAQEEKLPGATALHRHNMALRYMIKWFLRDLWITWRTLEGLPTPNGYEEHRLGIVHSQPTVMGVLEEHRGVV